MLRTAATRLARSTSPHTQSARYPVARKILPLLTLGALLLAPAGHTQEKERGWCGNEPHMPDLQVLDPDGKPAGRFPLEHTEVRAQVAGQTAQVTVEQRFSNPYATPIEAVYVFPLPHEAAVNDFEMRIGERIIRGEIHERQAAREIYENAKRAGRTAALLDQERPNIFTQSIANIMPGHEIVVRLRFVETLQYEDGQYEMVFPTVVGPRFIPGTPLGTGITPASSGTQPQRSGTGWAPDTDRVPDASRITPPVLPPGMRSGHDIGITVELDAGVALRDVRCESHAVDLVRDGRSRARVSLKSSDTIPNKDFILRWTVAGEGPEFGMLAYRDPTESPEGYFSFLLQPQANVTAQEARPKEMIFLLDTSGSMRGEPMAKVKAAMRWALQHLNPDDTFQIIRFSESASPFAAKPVANTPENVQRALGYIERLRGQGGTHMRAGIEAALRYPTSPERIRLVFFMTDGYIGNDAEILNLVRSLIGDARLFSFGIGSSVNRYLLDGLAEEGRGAVDYVALHADTREVVERFYARVSHPYLTDLQIDWGDLKVRDVQPARLPDLFAGQPLVVSGIYDSPGRGTVTVRGKLGRHDFERRVRVRLPERAQDHEEVAVLWARKRIAGLTSRMLGGEQAELVRQVTDLALRFRLVSSYTSFVAVDNQVVNERGETMLVAQPVPMPEGVSHEGVFGAPAPHLGKGPFKKLSAAMGRASIALAPPAPPGLRAEEAFDAPSRLPQTEPKEREVKPGEGSTSVDFELVVEPSQAEVSAASPIRIRVTLHNRTSRPIEVPEKLDLRDGSLVARVQLDGNPIPAPRPWSVATPATVRLAPGASRTWSVTLNATSGYAFAVPGLYRIEIGLGAPDVLGIVTTCELHVR
jgi:Ca-activated chloride channel family protein